MLVKHEHMRGMQPRYCNKGARKFCRRHGIDWTTFMTEGIPEDVLIATGDAMAIAVVEQARKQWAEKTSR